MRLTQSSMYALQALAYLSQQTQPVLSKEIAENLSISKTYLVKILQTLRLSGFLESSRGSRGGFCLKQHPSTIRFASVIELFEDLSQWSCCPFSEMICHGDPENRCQMHCKWEKVSEAFFDFVNTSTIADITPIGKSESFSTKPFISSELQSVKDHPIDH